MYRQRNSSSNSNSKRDQRGNYGKRRSSGGFGRSRGGSRNSRRMSSFDPSMLIQRAVPEAPKPEYVSTNLFVDFAIHADLKRNIVERGYETPTPIQDQVIPHILDGRDVIGLASTGTGKTAAFLIPLIHDVYERENHKVLIMAPTRELAVQIEAEFKLFSQGMGLYSALCIGGASMGRQIDNLRRKPEFVIGTPGRLIDLERQRKINFNSFSAIVLDEVDQMLDMGFINDMKYVIDKLPKERHSLFFSATLADKMTDIVNSFLQNPVKVQKDCKSNF